MRELLFMCSQKHFCCELCNYSGGRISDFPVPLVASQRADFKAYFSMHFLKSQSSSKKHDMHKWGLLIAVYNKRKIEYISSLHLKH